MSHKPYMLYLLSVVNITNTTSFSYFRYDGTDIVQNLKDCVEFRQKRSKGDKAIRWRIYCGWAHELRKREAKIEKTCHQLTQRSR